MESSSNSPSSPQNPRRDYMREYKRSRYNADKQTARAYNNSLVAKKKLGSDNAAQMWERYGLYLADVVKLQKLMEKIPREILVELVADATTTPPSL